MVTGPPVCWQALNCPAPPQFERRRGTVGGKEDWTLSSLELLPEAPRSHQAGGLGDDPEGCLLPRFNQRVLTHGGSWAPHSSQQASGVLGGSRPVAWPWTEAASLIFTWGSCPGPCISDPQGTGLEGPRVCWRGGASSLGSQVSALLSGAETSRSQWLDPRSRGLTWRSGRGEGSELPVIPKGQEQVAGDHAGNTERARPRVSILVL